MAFMTFAAIRGHAAQIAVLRQICASRHPAHAYLFEGPPGVGKQAVAWALAARLCCLNADTGDANGSLDDACGACRSCHALQRGEHPDIVLMTRDGAQIKIGQVREALKRLRYEPVLGRSKTLIIEDADTLREEAANALLKTLEEPAPATHFILVTSKPQLLIDTIRSRAQSLRFADLAPVDVQALLVADGHDPAAAQIASALAQGDLGRARELCDPNRLAIVDTVARHALALGTAPPSATPSFVDAITTAYSQLGTTAKKGRARLDRGGLSWLLDVLRAALRDVMLTGAGLDPSTLPHGRYADELGAAAARVDPLAVAAVLDQIDQLEQDMAYNPNPRIALEALLVSAAGTLR